MCTAVTYKTDDFYIGRTFDYDFSYGESVTVTPRGYGFSLRHGKRIKTEYAVIGMAHVAGDYPLYYDAVNEKGLGIAGLNFASSAHYAKPCCGKENIAQFELIPRLLGFCSSAAQAREALAGINITDTPFAPSLPCSPLHWIIADREEAFTLECTADGMKIYDNSVGVLTNEPPFDKQMFMLNNYRALSPEQPRNGFSDKLDLELYSRGMGALGLPGDLSSASRFARAAFVKMNSVSGVSESESVGQFYHILSSVEQQRGCCAVGDKYEITVYTSCCNATRGIYYYTTYTNRRINAVDMHKEDLDGDRLISYPLADEEDIRRIN